jgi:hypothetical protein
MTDVLGVQIEIDKWAQFCIPIEEMLPEVWVLLYQAVHGFSYRAAGNFNGRLTAGICS